MFPWSLILIIAPISLHNPPAIIREHYSRQELCETAAKTMTERFTVPGLKNVIYVCSLRG